MGIVYNTSIIRDGLRFQMDFANPKCYPGSGTTIFNLNRTGNFTFNSSYVPTFSNNIVSFDGQNPGTTIYETSGGLGNHGSSSFTYQFLLNPKISSSIDNAAEARVYEQAGWPDTYHIFGLYHNNGNPQFRFFGMDLNLNYFNITTPSGTAVLNNWYFITCILDRENSLSKLYINDTVYQSSFSLDGDVGNDDRIIFPSAYAEIEMDLSCFIGYSKALSDEEVKYNFNSLRGRYGI